MLPRSQERALWGAPLGSRLRCLGGTPLGTEVAGARRRSGRAPRAGEARVVAKVVVRAGPRVGGVGKGRQDNDSVRVLGPSEIDGGYGPLSVAHGPRPAPFLVARGVEAGFGLGAVRFSLRDEPAYAEARPGKHVEGRDPGDVRLKEESGTREASRVVHGLHIWADQGCVARLWHLGSVLIVSRWRRDTV